jgi:hypothetical protein
MTGRWIPLMDYAMKEGISLSTLRRYIKASKIPYRLENGRYLILDESHQHPSGAYAAPPKADTAVRQLESDLQRAQEEIAELKTLIALYEEKLPQHRLSS